MSEAPLDPPKARRGEPKPSCPLLREFPLYPSEREIAVAVLGIKRAPEWKSIAVLFERQGLPRISPRTGARYWPAVKAWLDRYNGLGAPGGPFAPDGVERDVP